MGILGYLGVAFGNPVFPMCSVLTVQVYSVNTDRTDVQQEQVLHCLLVRYFGLWQFVFAHNLDFLETIADFLETIASISPFIRYVSKSLSQLVSNYCHSVSKFYFFNFVNLSVHISSLNNINWNKNEYFWNFLTF